MTGYLGKHMLAEYYFCDEKLINNIHYLREQLITSAELAGATVINHSFHPFSPYGISGIVVVKESHFAIHTWPEHEYAAVDFFTCSTKMNFNLAHEYLSEKLKSGKSSFKILSRGDMNVIRKGCNPMNNKVLNSIKYGS